MSDTPLVIRKIDFDTHNAGQGRVEITTDAGMVIVQVNRDTVDVYIKAAARHEVIYEKGHSSKRRYQLTLREAKSATPAAGKRIG